MPTPFVESQNSLPTCPLWALPLGILGYVKQQLGKTCLLSEDNISTLKLLGAQTTVIVISGLAAVNSLMTMVIFSLVRS